MAATPNLTDNYEAKRETLKGYLADYKHLLQEEPEFVGQLQFCHFVKFSTEFDRQQRLTVRRQENVR